MSLAADPASRLYRLVQSLTATHGRAMLALMVLALLLVETWNFRKAALPINSAETQTSGCRCVR